MFGGFDFTYRYPLPNARRLFSFFPPVSVALQFAVAEMNSYTKAGMGREGGGENSKRCLPGVHLILSGLLLNL